MDRLEGSRLCDVRKVTTYLLNADHPIGASKEAFFRRFGFTAGAPDAMVAALIRHPDRNPLAKVERTDHGVRSTVECHVSTPDGRDPCIRSVWMLEHGSTIHRLVTAYPIG